MPPISVFFKKIFNYFPLKNVDIISKATYLLNYLFIMFILRCDLLFLYYKGINSNIYLRALDFNLAKSPFVESGLMV